MWYYEGKEIQTDEIPSGSIGFIYLITNIKNGKKYIGQKKLEKKVSKTLVKRDKKGNVLKDENGKSLKKKKRSIVESDWKDYFGSNEEIKKDVSENGSDNYHREILYFCDSKALMNFLETWLQFKHNVLFDDNFYNGIVNCRISQSQLKKFDLEKDIKPILEKLNKKGLT